MAVEFTCNCTHCGNTVAVIISGQSSDVRCPVCREPFETRRIIGYLYILSNCEMPGLLKIGQTTRPVEDRVAELNSATGVPAPFTVEAWFESFDPPSHEAELHKLFAVWRLPNREFFRVTIHEAITAARSVTGRAPVGFSPEAIQPPEEDDLLPPSASAWRPSFFRSRMNQFEIGEAY
jgi:hypothetical protein